MCRCEEVVRADGTVALLSGSGSGAREGLRQGDEDADANSTLPFASLAAVCTVLVHADDDVSAAVADGRLLLSIASA